MSLLLRSYRSLEAFAFISPSPHLPVTPLHSWLTFSVFIIIFCVILGVVNIHPTPGLFIPISYYLSLFPSLATSSCGHTPEPVVTNNYYFWVQYLGSHSPPTTVLQMAPTVLMPHNKWDGKHCCCSCFSLL